MSLWNALRTFFGLTPEDQDLARTVQRLWLLATLFWALLLGVDLFRAVLWFSRGYFVLLALMLFLDGVWGFSWAGKRLLLLGGLYLLFCGGGWVLGRFPGLPDFLALAWLLLSFSCLWPLFVTGDILGFPYNGAGYGPSCFLVWCGLALAWFLGRGIRFLRRLGEKKGEG